MITVWNATTASYRAQNNVGGAAIFGITDSTASEGFINASNAWRLRVDGTTRASLTATGLGIGTASAGAATHVVQPSSGIDTFLAENSASNNVIRLQAATSTNNYIDFYAGASSGSLILRGAATERARIDSSGRLLLGTSSATTGSLLAIAGGDIIIRKDSGGDVSGVDTYKYRLATQSGVLGEIFATSEGGGGPNGYGGAVKFTTKGNNESSPTERVRISSVGAIGLNGANFGTSGQVLTSQGSGAAPIWDTAASAATTQTFTSSGTWTKPSTGTMARIYLWGVFTFKSSFYSYGNYW